MFMVYKVNGRTEGVIYVRCRPDTWIVTTTQIFEHRTVYGDQVQKLAGHEGQEEL